MEEKIKKLVAEFKTTAQEMEEELRSQRHYTELARYGIQCQAAMLMMVAWKIEQELK